MSEAARVKVSDGSSWPVPDMSGDLCWTLTYGTPSREQTLRAVAIVRAYGHLVTEATAARRALIVRELRAASEHVQPCEHPPPPPGDFECCASGRCEVCSPGFSWG